MMTLKSAALQCFKKWCIFCCTKTKYPRLYHGYLSSLHCLCLSWTVYKLKKPEEVFRLLLWHEWLCNIWPSPFCSSFAQVLLYNKVSDPKGYGWWIHWSQVIILGTTFVPQTETGRNTVTSCQTVYSSIYYLT